MGIAKIENGTVVQIDRTTDEAPEGWLVVESEIVCGMLWDGEQFTVPAPTPDPVPASVSPRQARTALRAAGLLSAVNAAVAAAGEQAQIDWDYALEVRRDNPLIASMAAGLNLTSEQVDDLFRAAAQVV
jgi:hypothetical protein